MNGERSRLGCGSARPRAELKGARIHHLVCVFPLWTAPAGRRRLHPGRARSPFPTELLAKRDREANSCPLGIGKEESLRGLSIDGKQQGLEQALVICLRIDHE